MNSIYELEQMILKLWSHTDDIAQIANSSFDGEITPDQAHTMLIGNAELMNIKFDRLFKQLQISIREVHQLKKNRYGS